jgi:predicted TPR repeat methyltransferase
LVPAHATVHADLGVARLAMGEAQPALYSLTRALHLNPHLANAQYSLGAALVAVGQLADAERAYRRALELEPRLAVAHADLGELLERSGRLPEARHHLEQALSLAPHLTRIQALLGRTLLFLGDHPAAVACYRTAGDRDPTDVTAQINLGVALRLAGEHEASLAALGKAIELSPNHADAHGHLAAALLAFGRPQEAIASARQSLSIAPSVGETRLTLASALIAAGRLDEGIVEAQKATPDERREQVLASLGTRLAELGAAEASLACFERLLQLDPGHALAGHLVAASQGKSLERDPTGYVRALFDSYADNFDQHLSSLGYQTPRKLLAEILAVSHTPRPWDCLDLGCGTGLFGVELAPLSRRLAGVDVSPNMIERARALSIYTDLLCTDLLSALEQEVSGGCDLVAAADVFVYVGRLDDIVPQVRRVLKPDGLFAFSVEAMDSHQMQPLPGYLAGVRGRYAHSIGYLDALAEKSGFKEERRVETPLRTEQGKPVQGYLLVWRAPGQ